MPTKIMWTVALNGGPCRVNHAAARVGDFIYSFGGYSTTDELNDWDPIQVHILNTQSLRWSTGPSFTTETAPYHRYGHSVVAVDKKIYLWGGRNNSEGFDTVSCFDTTTYTWQDLDAKGSVPLAKDGHSACIINNKMYIFGGFEFITNQYSQEIHCLDLATLQWTFIRAKGSLPSHRDFHTAVAVGHFMYVFGGRGDLMMMDYEAEVYCQNLYRFNTITETWECIEARGDIPDGRRSHSAWYYNGYMYIFGGYNGITGKHNNDLHRISTQNHTWEIIKVQGKGPCVRRRQCCLMYSDKLYLFGGTSPHPKDTSSGDNEKTVDNDDLYVLDFNVSLRTMCILEVMKLSAGDVASLPENICWDIYAMTVPNTINRLHYIYEEETTNGDDW